uniref:Uncharacterized protein n=1 Tax=Micrurus corallinus TaxID=54390 RepID=A0A2D4GCZ0_MICCO
MQQEIFCLSLFPSSELFCPIILSSRLLKPSHCMPKGTRCPLDIAEFPPKAVVDQQNLEMFLILVFRGGILPVFSGSVEPIVLKSSRHRTSSMSADVLAHPPTWALT